MMEITSGKSKQGDRRLNKSIFPEKEEHIPSTSIDTTNQKNHSQRKSTDNIETFRHSDQQCILNTRPGHPIGQPVALGPGPISLMMSSPHHFHPSIPPKSPSISHPLPYNLYLYRYLYLYLHLHHPRLAKP